MNEKAPRYTVETPGMPTRELGVLWLVIQYSGEKKRTVGYFSSFEDAEAYVSMAMYCEKLAADPQGNRRV